MCPSIAICVVLLSRLGHCHSLHPRQPFVGRHKTNGLILGDASDCFGATNSDVDRREILRQWIGSAIAFGLVSSSPILSSAAPNDSVVRHPFVYSDSWKGTNLKIMSLEESTNSGAYARDESGYSWAMGKWPDPALRFPAKPIDLAMWSEQEQWQKLELAATILRDTALREGAVGLAAQQCGVDARMVFLSASGGGSDMVLVNPRIVARSPESSMKVWTEECLVLPPTFRATVLRDDWIEVEYDFSYDYRSQRDKTQKPPTLTSSSNESLSTTGLRTPVRKRFYKEQSRCLQHELDHDRGILITDHVGLDELENDVMRRIEAEDHERRQALAYSRQQMG